MLIFFNNRIPIVSIRCNSKPKTCLYDKVIYDNVDVCLVIDPFIA